MKSLTLLVSSLVLTVMLTANSMAADLNGTWKGSQVGGDPGDWTFVFADSQLTVNGPSDYFKLKVTFLEGEKHKQVKAKFIDASDPSVTGLSTTAIYKLEKGVLTIAASEPGYGSVPKSFDATWGVYVFKMTKVVKKKKQQ